MDGKNETGGTGEEVLGSELAVGERMWNEKCGMWNVGAGRAGRIGNVE